MALVWVSQHWGVQSNRALLHIRTINHIDEIGRNDYEKDDFNGMLPGIEHIPFGGLLG